MGEVGTLCVDCFAPRGERVYYSVVHCGDVVVVVVFFTFVVWRRGRLVFRVDYRRWGLLSLDYIAWMKRKVVFITRVLIDTLRFRL